MWANWQCEIKVLSLVLDRLWAKPNDLRFVSVVLQSPRDAPGSSICGTAGEVEVDMENVSQLWIYL